jgi:cell division septation protein DedD
MDYSRDEDGLPRKERELTLSMSAILGIFFGLVLLCGLFFGLGYNMRGRQITAAANADPDLANSTNPAFNNFKPAAGSPAGSKPVVVVAPDSAPASQPTATGGTGTVSAVNLHAATPANGTTGSTGPTQPNAAPIVRLAPSATGHPSATVSVPTAPSASGSAAGTAVTATPVTATGSFLVQVAAVSHQEDADLLMAALKGRGYAVNARTESQDKLVHIQIGPFSNRKDAEAMRQRLQGDGYNAIIK